MTNSTPLVFFGSDDFSLAVLKGLVETGYTVDLVVTTPEPAAGSLTTNPVSRWSRQNHLPLIAPPELNQTAISDISKTPAQFAVLASYGKLLPNKVLGLFKAIVNVHPSLLPRWRGPSPIEAAILSDDAQTGVTLIRLDAKMDAGPIYAQTEFKLTGREDQLGLRRRLAEVGRDLLMKKLPDIVSGRLLPSAQSEEQATYCHLISKSDGWLDWQEPAKVLERKVRAFAHWPKARGKLSDREIIVTQARVEPGKGRPGQIINTDGRLAVQSGQDQLVIERLKPPGRKEMGAAEFLRGWRL
jgi:methionyl-tRNA formyltransferase